MTWPEVVYNAGMAAFCLLLIATPFWGSALAALVDAYADRIRKEPKERR